MIIIVWIYCYSITTTNNLLNDVFSHYRMGENIIMIFKRSGVCSFDIKVFKMIWNNIIFINSDVYFIKKKIWNKFSSLFENYLSEKNFTFTTL